MAALPVEAACGDAALCSARERAQVACEMREALEARYVFLGVKGRLLDRRAGGFDSRRHLDACVAAERAIAREDEPLRFYDRMRRCVSAFEDGHLLLGVPAGLPEVSLGVGLRLAEGRVFVASRERRLFARLEAEERPYGAASLLAPGNEVLEIDGRGRAAVRTGVVSRASGGAFCYLQILTFHAETLAAAEGRRPFPAVLESFVRGCRERSLDLVLDLRENEGGFISHTTALAAALAAPGRALPAGALLLRASERNQAVYEQRAPRATASADPLDPSRIAGAIGAALRERREFTPAFLEAPLRPSDPAGYPDRIVALVSARCMSACDRLAAMLRESGRAVLVGTPTEGAGGSQQETKDLGARWTDDAGLLSLSIPNAAMGVQQAASSPATGEAAADEFFRALALENRPVRPDVRYATRRADLVSSNRGWLERVEAVLFGSGEAGAAGR